MPFLEVAQLTQSFHRTHYYSHPSHSSIPHSDAATTVCRIRIFEKKITFDSLTPPPHTLYSQWWKLCPAFSVLTVIGCLLYLASSLPLSIFLSCLTLSHCRTIVIVTLVNRSVGNILENTQLRLQPVYRLPFIDDDKTQLVRITSCPCFLLHFRQTSLDDLNEALDILRGSGHTFFGSLPQHYAASPPLIRWRR